MESSNSGYRSSTREGELQFGANYSDSRLFKELEGLDMLPDMDEESGGEQDLFQ